MRTVQLSILDKLSVNTVGKHPQVQATQLETRKRSKYYTRRVQLHTKCLAIDFVTNARISGRKRFEGRRKKPTGL